MAIFCDAHKCMEVLRIHSHNAIPAFNKIKLSTNWMFTQKILPELHTLSQQ